MSVCDEPPQRYDTRMPGKLAQCIYCQHLSRFQTFVDSYIIRVRHFPAYNLTDSFLEIEKSE